MIVTVPVDDLLPVTDAVELREGLGDSDPLVEREGESVPEGDRETEEDLEVLIVRLGDPLVLEDFDSDDDPDGDRERVGEALGAGDCDGDAEKETHTLMLPEEALERLRLEEPEAVPPAHVAVMVTFAVGVGGGMGALIETVTVADHDA